MRDAILNSTHRLNTGVIDVREVSFSYSRKTRPSLDGVTWHVPQGISALLGPNGAGKSTLLSCIVGELKPNAGEIVITQPDDTNTKRIRSSGSRNFIGFVPQHSTVPNGMKCIDVVAYVAWLEGLENNEIWTSAMEALESVGLSIKAKYKVKSLSGGQYQRLLIACGIVHKPSVLILDEPTAGLDPTQRINIRRVIATQHAFRSVIIATHLMEDVQHLCQHACVLSGGRVSFAGSVDDLIIKAKQLHSDEGHGSALELAYEQLVEDGVS